MTYMSCISGFIHVKKFVNGYLAAIVQASVRRENEVTKYAPTGYGINKGQVKNGGIENENADRESVGGGERAKMRDRLKSRFRSFCRRRGRRRIGRAWG